MTKEEAAACALSLEGAVADRPFGDEVVILRHSANGKWFGAFLEHGGRLLLNLKCEPGLAVLLRENVPGVLPGWHMNKTHWNSVVLSECPEDEIVRMIGHSYELTKPKRRQKK